MLEGLKAVRVLGVSGALRLYRAYRWGWMDIIRGYYTTRTLQALFNVGFFDEMRAKGKVDARSFAEERGLDFEILKSLCDSLYALSIFGQNGSGYVLESRGKILAEVARGWFHGTYGYESVLHELEALLKKEKSYGKEVTRRLEHAIRGSGEMEAFLHFPLAIDRIRKAGYRQVLDLGCGDAAFLRAFCAADSTATGRGIDVSQQMVERGRELVREAGLEGRIELLVADINGLDAPPRETRGVDVATAFLLLHEMLFRGNDAALRFLTSYRRLFPEVPLLVFELIRPTLEEMRKRPGMAVQYLLHHDLTHQRPVSRKEWKDLFRDAGFRSIEEWHLGFARTSVFALS